jgi:hypothetical protein
MLWRKGSGHAANVPCCCWIAGVGLQVGWVSIIRPRCADTHPTVIWF